MIKKFEKHENGQAIVIDQALLELLGINPAAEFKLSTDGTSLIITPICPIKPEAQGISETQDEFFYRMFSQGPDAWHKTAIEQLPYQERIALMEAMQESSKQENYLERIQALTKNPDYEAKLNEFYKQAYSQSFTPEAFDKGITAIIKSFDSELGKLHEKIKKDNDMLVEKYAAKNNK